MSQDLDRESDFIHPSNLSRYLNKKAKMSYKSMNKTKPEMDD